MFTSKHNPDGGATQHFDNGRLESLIANYQAGSNPTAALGEIVELTQRRALTLVRFNGTTRYVSEDELLSDINCKLIKAVRRFDPSRGSAFTFISRVAQSVLWTSVTNARKNAERHVELDAAIIKTLHAPASSESQEGADDLAHRVRAGVKTTLTEPDEIGMQKWFVESFCQDGFDSLRYQCANAAMRVYGIRHDRSRELYDLSMLEVRRVLYPDLKRREPIPPGRLLGTRAMWMLRYVPLMTTDEFTKFFTLARDLSPFILLLIAPRSHSRRQDRNATIGRQNLEWVLYGHPSAVPLYENGK
jgi:hypothetical protein